MNNHNISPNYSAPNNPAAGEPTSIVFAPWSGTSIAALLAVTDGNRCRRKIAGIGKDRLAALTDLGDQCRQYGEAPSLRIVRQMERDGSDVINAAPWRDWPMGVDQAKGDSNGL